MAIELKGRFLAIFSFTSKWKSITVPIIKWFVVYDSLEAVEAVSGWNKVSTVT